MNDRRASFARNILALGAMFGGMPIYAGMPRARPEPIVHPEPKAIAIDLGVSYEDAERVWKRFGTVRAREVLTVCLEHGVSPSHEILRLLEPEPKAKSDTAALLRPAVPEARQERRPLAERKARRAKRKQRGKR